MYLDVLVILILALIALAWYSPVWRVAILAWLATVGLVAGGLVLLLAK